jgi:hypothetical protein
MQSILTGSDTVPDLYIRTGAKPPPHKVNSSLQRRVDLFNIELQRNFTKRQSKPNLLPFQQHILRTLRQQKDFMIFPADKNLGPCLIERSVYIQRALTDHLSDTTTYVQLTKAAADNHITLLTRQVNDFIVNFKTILSKQDTTFLRRSLNILDPYPKFYLTAKVHKSPWKTRPIVSISGSLLHGLGRWVDKHLKPYATTIPSYVSSSFVLKDLLLNLPPLPKNARLFTCDAVSMYTNISTTHALQEIRQHLIILKNNMTTRHDKALTQALSLVMKNNIFVFGDTYWRQLDGTAMGVSPSCAYATLYFHRHEQWLKQKYHEIYFLKRYIDDIFGIWIPHDATNDDARWQEFQNDINLFGKLRWEFTARATTAIFLDLRISIDSNGKLQTALYEKPENMYLYLPANSNHPPGVLKGLVFGMIYRTIRLSSDDTTHHIDINNLLTRLMSRGYDQTYLIKLINKAYIDIRKKYLMRNHTPTTTRQPQRLIIDDLERDDRMVLFHLDYHPQDPPSSYIQNLFYDQIYFQTGLPDLPDLRRPDTNEKIGINRLVVCYHRFPNLGNIFSPRRLKAEDGPLVSTFLSGN